MRGVIIMPPPSGLNRLLYDVVRIMSPPSGFEEMLCDGCYNHVTLLQSCHPVAALLPSAVRVRGDIISWWL